MISIPVIGQLITNLLLLLAEVETVLVAYLYPEEHHTIWLIKKRGDFTRTGDHHQSTTTLEVETM